MSAFGVEPSLAGAHADRVEQGRSLCEGSPCFELLPFGVFYRSALGSGEVVPPVALERKRNPRRVHRAPPVEMAVRYASPLARTRLGARRRRRDEIRWFNCLTAH